MPGFDEVDARQKTRFCEIMNCNELASARPDGSGQLLCHTHATVKQTEVRQAAEELAVRARELERARTQEERAAAISELTEIVRGLNQ